MWVVGCNDVCLPRIMKELLLLQVVGQVRLGQVTCYTGGRYLSRRLPCPHRYHLGEFGSDIWPACLSGYQVPNEIARKTRRVLCHFYTTESLTARLAKIHVFIKNFSVIWHMPQKFLAHFGVSTQIAPKISAHSSVNQLAPKFSGLWHSTRRR